MRKTLALFILALSLLITALVVGIQHRSAAPPTPTPAPVVSVNIPVPVPTAEPGAEARFGDLVTAHARLGAPFVQAGQPGAMSLLVDLTAKSFRSTERAPIALAVVIDRSGSMAGEKIRQARRAAKDLVARLDDSDQVALVTYSSDYSLDLPLTPLRGQRNRINRVIDEILDGGGTNLAGGLEASLSALRTVSDRNVLRRVILLSDGQANQGITDPGAIASISARARRDGISVSTLGVGLDFNEDLMTLIAQSAGGGYYYARNAAAIAAAFEKELAGLQELAARSVELALETPPGVTIREVYGYRTELRRGRTVIPVGDMTSGEHRRILVQLDLAGAPEGAVRITELVLSYTGAQTRADAEHHAGLTAVSTHDAQRVASHSSREVVEAFEAAIAARAREEAAARFSSGERDRAASQLRLQITETRRKNASLKSGVLDNQVAEMERALDQVTTYELDSDDAKDLVKSEKLRAREVFAY